MRRHATVGALLAGGVATYRVLRPHPVAVEVSGGIHAVDGLRVLAQRLDVAARRRLPPVVQAVRFDGAEPGGDEVSAAVGRGRWAVGSGQGRAAGRRHGDRTRAAHVFSDWLTKVRSSSGVNHPVFWTSFALGFTRTSPGGWHSRM